MHRAFSIIELMVVVAIIAILLSLLTPSLGQSRKAAHAAECASTLRQLATAQHAYAVTWKDYYASLLTSGAEAYWTKGASVLGDTASEMPTSSNDWISPIVGATAGFSPNRARRTQQIFSQYACPATTSMNDSLYPSHPGDERDFLEILKGEGFRQISYLAPEGFHYNPDIETANANKYRGEALKVAHSSPVKARNGFRPRIDQVGTDVSKKIVAADGTRYLDPIVNPRLDFDPDPCPERANLNNRVGWYGSFLTSGPIYSGSTAYGRSSASRGKQLPLTFRHEGERIQAAFFDGHVGSLTKEQAWSDPVPWYPSDSTFTGKNTVSATEESLKIYDEGDNVP